MRPFIPPGKSLKFYTVLSWAIPGAIAILCCLFIFTGSSMLSYRSEVTRIESELSEKSITAARRLSAELLLGTRGATQSVSDLLKDELRFQSVSVVETNPCEFSNDSCFKSEPKVLNFFRRIPVIAESKYVKVTVTAPKLSSFFSLSTLLWGTLPIAFMFAIGLLFQRFILKRYVLNPIKALVETSTGSKEPREYWPEEIKNISGQLYSSFEIRDKEVFSQIARGVIHDLRTLIHAPLASVELVEEAEDNTEKRSRRLENLQTTCAQQLPKMKDIIDHTLDGSRDISIRVQEATLESSIQGAIKTLDGLIKSSKTVVETAGNFDTFVLAHDSIQLERAITNILKNGIEACQEVTEENRKVRILATNQEAEFSISIEDSGSGLTIPSNKLFRPLKSTKVHGSGLGLLVSRKIIEAHGGNLSSSKSDSLGGARFTISLPKDSRQEASL